VHDLSLITKHLLTIISPAHISSFEAFTTFPSLAVYFGFASDQPLNPQQPFRTLFIATAPHPNPRARLILALAAIGSSNTLTMAPGTASVAASAPNVNSKSAKNKRAKAEAQPTSPTGSATPGADATSQASPADVATNGVDGAHDSPYLKELNK
jgi:hypothetical protein